MTSRETALALARELNIERDLRESIVGAVTMLGGPSLEAPAEEIFNEVKEEMLEAVADGYTKVLGEEMTSRVLDLLQSDTAKAWEAAQPDLAKNFNTVMQKYTQELGPRLTGLIMEAVRREQEHRDGLDQLDEEIFETDTDPTEN